MPGRTRWSRISASELSSLGIHRTRISSVVYETRLLHKRSPCWIFSEIFAHRAYCKGWKVSLGGAGVRPDEIARLKRIRLFAGLSSQDLETVAARGKQRNLAKNTVFIDLGDKSTNLYLILSGKVKVFVPDGQGNEQVLSIRGPGEHLGELALLTDAVRTASAVTMEDTDLLVLSRRDFVDCLTACPQISLNLDNSLEERALAPDIGEKLAGRCRAWSRFRNSGLPLVVLIEGCTGTGKSTVASELALRLDIARVTSTDILRDVVRLFVPEQQAPELHVSSYDAWRVAGHNIDDGRQDHLRLTDGFRAQSDRLVPTIDAVIERSVKEQASIIIEGIHVHPEYASRIEREDAVVIPLVLINPSQQSLKRHFLRRGEFAPSRGAAKYLENFSAIWNIQKYLISEAKRFGVPCIANADLEETIRRVFSVISDRLEKKFT